MSDQASAPEFIDRVGIATLFPASLEVPNLFHAYLGDPDAHTDSGHDTPSGEVYGWRWYLGRREAAFYSAVVRNRPTWVSWPLLPSILRLVGELRAPDELYDLGEISDHAHRIAGVLENAGGTLSTGELRREAGFPTGKENRAAYLKAVAELDSRMLLAKVFSTTDHDMRHTLVSVRYAKAVEQAEALSRESALDALLMTYLPQAVYAVPLVLGKHLGVPEIELHAGLDRLVAVGSVRAVDGDGPKGASYVWARESW
ncbi:MAG: AlkZ-related protein [Chloroflexota bacterium]|nr:MAG: hypothetical protein DLM70_12985 [Chloroflexota bacterium]